MSIDIAEPINAIPQVVDAVRRHAGESVDGAIDAARTARRDVERTVRDVERKVGRSAKRLRARAEPVLPRPRPRFTAQRILVAVLVIGGLAAVAAVVARRLRAGALVSGDSNYDDMVADGRDGMDVAAHDGAADAMIAP